MLTWSEARAAPGPVRWSDRPDRRAVQTGTTPTCPADSRKDLASHPLTGQPGRVSWELDEVPSLVEQLGAEEVGRLYAIRKRERLRAIRAGTGPTADEEDNDPSVGLRMLLHSTMTLIQSCDSGS